MIHVCTVHHRDDRWVDVQADALDRWLGPHRVHAVLDHVATDRYEPVRVRSSHHGDRLDALAAHVVAVGQPDDLIVFLDGDAWPVADPLPTITRALDASVLVAVRRDEGSGAGWPHPSFCATTVARWRGLRASWKPAVWPDRNVKHRYDVGVGVLLALGKRPWTPLLRSNTTNPHPLFFAAYGADRPIVYHHGAGFRPPVTSTEGRTAADLDQVRDRNQAMSDEIHAAACRDPEFWRFLCD